jgi:cation diffusion facilitator family transporter
MSATRKMALLSIATSIATLLLKFGAWYITGSVSLLSDAVEAFVNLAAGLVALGALTVAETPADERHAYGHDKAEYFASGVEGTLIIVAAVSIVAAAWQRFAHPAPLENIALGTGVAALAAAMNYATARLMLRAAKLHDSITLEADAKHLLTDVWTSAGVITGLLVILFVPHWQILDPLVAMAVAAHIVLTGVGLLRRSVDGLMDAALPAEEIAVIESALRERLPAGTAFAALRTRKAGSRRFVELNLLVDGTSSVDEAHALCDRLEHAVAQSLPRTEVVIHVEPHAARPDLR